LGNITLAALVSGQYQPAIFTLTKCFFPQNGLYQQQQQWEKHIRHFFFGIITDILFRQYILF